MKVLVRGGTGFVGRHVFFGLLARGGALGVLGEVLLQFLHGLVVVDLLHGRDFAGHAI